VNSWDEQLFLNPSLELLRLCVRPEVDAATAARIKTSLCAELEWAKLLELAHWHGLLPLLHRHLNAVCPELLPEAFARQLTELYRRNAVRNHYLVSQLLELLQIFAAHGIGAIPFKGPALAVSVYGDVALRQFVDLDILVRRPDVLKAKALLATLGYEPKLSIAPPSDEDALRFHYHYAAWRKRDGILVEVHWDLAANYLSFPFAEMRLWERLHQIILAGTAVPAPAPEDLLLLLCHHGTRHLWGKLEWIGSVAALARVYPQSAWPHLLERAAALRSGRALRLGLGLADELLAVELPDFVRADVQADAALAPLLSQVLEAIGQGQPGQPDLLTRQRFHLSSRESFSDKLKYCFYYAVSPGTTEWGKLRLPARLSWLYRPLRLARLARVYGALFLKYLFRGSSRPLQ
jgi:hypothetical protein